MSNYNKYSFRVPDGQAFLQDVLQVALENDIDPRTHNPPEIKENDDGSLEAGFGVNIVMPGYWWETRPTYKDDGLTQRTEGVRGDYALADVLTKRREIINLIEQFAASDPAKDPSEIPDSEKIGSGTHRIDHSKITTPAVRW